MPEDDQTIDLGEVVDALKPYLRGMVQTIGEAGSATTDEESGKVTPGDIRAASIGIELVSKYLSGRGADRASKLLEAIAKVRADSTAEEDGGPQHPTTP